MTRIRILNFFDKKNTQDMLSMLNNNFIDKYLNYVMYHPLMPLHHLLPLNLKFLPESYTIKDDKILKGLITIAPTKCKNKKMEIQKLLCEENSFNEASELVQFAVSKYKAMGVTSIQVKVDDYMSELLSMFVSKCGFSQISGEKLWRINKYPTSAFDKDEYRIFKSSDIKSLECLYNDSLLPHFKPLLGRELNEFKDSIFQGLSYYSEYKYIIEDKNTKNINGALLISTVDNENFIIDIIQNNWIELSIEEILSFAFSQIRKRKQRFGVFIKSKQYTYLNEKYENKFIENGYECVQSQLILTNSSAKVLKESAESVKYTAISNIFPTDPISTHCNKL